VHYLRQDLFKVLLACFAELFFASIVVALHALRCRNGPSCFGHCYVHLDRWHPLSQLLDVRVQRQLCQGLASAWTLSSRPFVAIYIAADCSEAPEVVPCWLWLTKQVGSFLLEARVENFHSKSLVCTHAEPCRCRSCRTSGHSSRLLWRSMRLRCGLGKPVSCSRGGTPGYQVGLAAGGPGCDNHEHKEAAARVPASHRQGQGQLAGVLGTDRSPCRARGALLQGRFSASAPYDERAPEGPRLNAQVSRLLIQRAGCVGVYMQRPSVCVCVCVFCTLRALPTLESCSGRRHA
jgi:hypothetical protein